MVAIPSRPQSTDVAPIIHVECCIKSPGLVVNNLSQVVVRWMRQQFAVVRLGDSWSSLPGLDHADDIIYVKVSDLTSFLDFEIIRLAEVNIEVDVFHYFEGKQDLSQSRSLQPDNHSQFPVGNDEEDEVPHAKLCNLPHQQLHGIWDTLVFRDAVQFRLLRFILRMINISNRQLQRNIVKWNRLILFYGPPGTGKSSLCQALAQQLSIRLRTTFPSSQLIDVDAHSLFSKWFGESGKIISKLFDTIHRILEKDPTTFICVVIDEIEDLACQRQTSSKSSEPHDSVRAVNALLVALDKLRYRPNVLIFCTSNLMDSIDPAFLDRVDIKEHIPEPCAAARYEILRASYLEMAQSGIIALVQPRCYQDTEDMADHSMGSTPTLLEDPSSEDHVLNDEDLPKFVLRVLKPFSDPGSLVQKLCAVVEETEGLSGRTLQRLPTLSLAMYARQDPCPIDEAFVALYKAVPVARQSQSQRRGYI